VVDTSREDEREYRAGCADHGGSARAWFEAAAAAVVARMLQQDTHPLNPSRIRSPENPVSFQWPG
jgi:hypothetical protein